MIERYEILVLGPVAIAIAMTVIALGVAVLRGPDPVGLEARQYCEMVGIYHDSNGEYGWPDFKHIYEEHCHE